MSRSQSTALSLRLIREKWPVLLLVITAVAFAAPTAFAAEPGGSVQRWSVTVTGTVTNSLTEQGIAGANVSFAALNATFSAVTNATGAYSVQVAANASYDVTFAATNFTTETLTGSIVKNEDATLDKALEPIAEVIVEASATVTDANPGDTIGVSGTCLPLDGSTVIGTEWSQIEGTTAVIDDFGAASTSVELAQLGAYKDELIHLLKEPPITDAELPPNVPPPPSGFVGGLQDRTQVVAVVPYTLERAGHVGLKLVCTTTSGEYSAAVNISTALPWPVTTGLRTVPFDVPVLLYARDCVPYTDTVPEPDVDVCVPQTNYKWTVESPAGPDPFVWDDDTQSAWFTPEGIRTFAVHVTAESADPSYPDVGLDAGLEVHSGFWRGVIDPILTADSIEFGDGLPVGDERCTACHDDGFAPDAFTPWRETGHAHAFSDGLNTNGHFSENCFGCHAVGVNPDASNAGFDDTPNYNNFVDSGLLNNPNPDNWLDMLLSYPDTARLANIQCESCHGPQSYTDAHGGVEGEPRVSVASEVCASCHGEPARHGRYQQWQLSRHSNYELAVDEGDSPNCSRCHTGNGFVAWSKVGFEKDTTVTVTWDEDTVHPQTCAACHGPHETGTTSGSDPNAGVRIDGDSPELISGYTAIGIGKGALCITCHNTRRGLRNDDVFDSLSDSDKTRGPHGPTQGDLMMGMNAYFVEVGVRGKHSLIEDTCVTCHMEKTPPPALLSYNQTGTNHTFFADKTVVCSNCHGSLNANGVQATVNSLMSNLVTAAGEGYKRLLTNALPVTIGGTVCPTPINSPADIGTVTWNSSTSVNVQVWDPTSFTFVSCGNRNPNAILVTYPGAATLFELSLLPDGGDGALVKAGWNYAMSNNDGSRGLHNPAFTTQMLQNALNAVNAIQ